MKKFQVLFWVSIALFVGHVAYTQDETPAARAYMARVEFINGATQPGSVEVAYAGLGGIVR